MAGSDLTPMSRLSPEEQQAFRERAQQARKEKREAAIAYAEQNFKLDYEDETAWRDMASEFGVRLPAWYDAPTPKNIRKFLKKVGKDSNWFNDVNGTTKLDQWQQMNPRWSMLACAGIILEELYYATE